MTYTACGDPPLYPNGAVISITTTGIGTDWNTPVFYEPVNIDYGTLPYTSGYISIIGGGTTNPPYGASPLEGLQKQLLDQEKIQKLMEYLQKGQLQPSFYTPSELNYEPPVQELAPVPKEEPEPAQDLTRPFQRKLDLD